MCVVPYIAFYVSVCYFTKTRSNLLWFWLLHNLAVHTNTYMLHDQLFLILSHLFFHNAIALPVLKFIFNLCLSFSFPLGYPRETERLHHDGWWTILGRGGGTTLRIFFVLNLFHVCLFHWVISVRLKDCTIMADELCKAGGWENDLENIFRT